MYNQQQVRYRRGYPLYQCSVCSMYRKGGSTNFGRCTDVTGQITPYGMCDLIHRLDNPYGNHATRAHQKAIADIYDHAHGYASPASPYHSYHRRLAAAKG